jgi:hypothetical protein
MIDLRRKSSFVIENLINNDLTGEANTRYGAASTKYVSRIITLDENQDAEDLLITVSAYRPSGTDITVYAKFLSAEDSEQIDDKVWTEMVRRKGAFDFSNPLDQNAFIDFDFSMPSTAPATNPNAAYLDSSDGVVTYQSSSGSLHKSFKNYMIKIALTSNNPARVPLLNDCRAIALQV